MLSTPRESVRAAFKMVLDNADLGVTVHDRLPFEGADQRSVVLTIVSGTSKSSGVGMWDKPLKRTTIQQYKLQVDCYYDEMEGCSKLADAVEQAIIDAHDDLRLNHDIHNLRKVVDVDTLRLGSTPLTREARVILDFTFWTHRELAT